MRLSNIQSKWDAEIERTTAYQNSAKAMLEYYQTTGGENVDTIRGYYKQQADRQREIIRSQEKAVEEYEKELERAAKIYGKESEQYKQAEAALVGMKTQVIESKTALYELEKASKDTATAVLQSTLEKADKKYNSLARMSSASQSVREAQVAYYTASGVRANSSLFKDAYNSERKRLEEQKKYYTELHATYEQ